MSTGGISPAILCHLTCPEQVCLCKLGKAAGRTDGIHQRACAPQACPFPTQLLDNKQCSSHCLREGFSGETGRHGRLKQKLRQQSKEQLEQADQRAEAARRSCLWIFINIYEVFGILIG